MEKEYKKRDRSDRGDRDNRDRDDDKGDGKRGSWRRRERPSLDLVMDYKDIDTLRSFLSEGGRIVPSRVNRLNRQQQKQLTSEIKRARHLALIPIADSHNPVGR